MYVHMYLEEDIPSVCLPKEFGPRICRRFCPAVLVFRASPGFSSEDTYSAILMTVILLLSTPALAVGCNWGIANTSHPQVVGGSLPSKGIALYGVHYHCFLQFDSNVRSKLHGVTVIRDVGHPGSF